MAAELAPLVDEIRNLFLGPGQVALAALGQSGFLLRLNGTVALVDPFLSQTRDRLVPADTSLSFTTGIDLLACTHEHRDHLDLPALTVLFKACPAARLAVPEPIVGIVVNAGVEPSRIAPAQPGRPLSLGGLMVEPVAARHGVEVADAYTFGTELSGGLVRYLGYVFSGPGVAVYHAGDTILYEGLAQKLRSLKVNIALLPINGRDPEREKQGLVGNLNAEEAAELAAEAGVQVMVPMHYDMFARNPGRPEAAIAAARGRSVTVAVLARGAPLVFGSLPLQEGFGA